MPDIRLRLPRPHPAQRYVLATGRRFNVLDCGRRWGKTVVGVDRSAEMLLRGGSVGWFAPTYRILADAIRQIEIYFEPLIDRRRSSKSEHRWVMRTGGVLEAWSLQDEHAGRSREYDRVIIDEAALVRDLEKRWQGSIRPTLVRRRGDAWILSSPLGMNYFQEMWSWGHRSTPAAARKPGWMSWQMPTSTNPFIPPSELEAARAELTLDYFEQEFLAKFVTARGRVYYAADEQTFTGRPFDPHNPQLIVGQDFNLRFGALSIGQMHPDKLVPRAIGGESLHVFHEIVDTHDTYQAAQQLREYLLSLKVGGLSIDWWPDASGGNGHSAALETNFGIMKAAVPGMRMRIRDANPPVRESVVLTNSVLRAADGTRRLYVYEGSKGIRRDLLRQQYDKHGDPDPTPGGDYGHPADSVRYPVWGVFPMNPANIRHLV